MNKEEFIAREIAKLHKEMPAVLDNLELYMDTVIIGELDWGKLPQLKEYYLRPWNNTDSSVIRLSIQGFSRLDGHSYGNSVVIPRETLEAYCEE